MSAYQTYPRAPTTVFATAPAIYAGAPTTIASAPTVVNAPAITYGGYTGASTTSWSHNNTMNLGDETTAKPLLNRVPQLKEASSVRTAVDLLNSGAVNMPGGVCIVYSANQKQYFALYRSDRLKEFTEIFGSLQATSVGASVVTAAGSQAQAYGTGITPPRGVQGNLLAAPAVTTIAAPAITSFAAPAVTTIAAPAVTAPVGLPLASSMIAYPGLDGPFKFSAETSATTPKGDLPVAPAPPPEAKAAAPTPEAKAAGKAKKESKKKAKACC